MSNPIVSVTVQPVAGADAEVMTTFYAVPSLGLVPINAFLLHAQELVLVDTGPIVYRDQYLDALTHLVDLSALRWIYLTHADPDHVGCLRDVLAAAPRARVVTTFVGFGKLGLYASLPPDRIYLLNPGQRLSVGDRELRVLEPITFDAPETTTFVDSKTGVLFSSDSFGGIVSSPVARAADVPREALRDGMVTWTTIDSPWLGKLEASKFEESVKRVRETAPPIVLSSHLPPATGMLDVLLDNVATARTFPRYVGPDQAALMAMLASLGQPAAAE